MVLGGEFFTQVVTPIINGGASINKAFADMVAGVKTSIAGLLSGDLTKALEGLQQFLVGSPNKPPPAHHAPAPGAAPLPVAGEEEPGGWWHRRRWRRGARGGKSAGESRSSSRRNLQRFSVTTALRGYRTKENLPLCSAS